MNGAWRGVTVRLIALDEPAAFDSGLVLVAIPTEVVDHAWLAPIVTTRLGAAWGSIAKHRIERGIRAW